MCGINGVFGLKSENEGREIIELMNRTLAHRGPNENGVFISKHMAFGHQRLSVIDLSASSNQPMTDPSGRYTLVFNGAIYNYQELRKSLSSYDFKSNGDTEVLLAGLIRWGSQFLQMCNGMFAFGFWDSDKEELLLARDRMGIKPMYYARTIEAIVFSSEVRPILKSGIVDRKLNTDVIGDYLRYQTVHGSSTMVQGVHRLPQGSLMRITSEEVKIESYWNAASQLERGLAGMNYEDTKKLVREKFEKAVDLRLIADVPTGVFLSGGIDSSALVGVAAQKSQKPLKTFTITFDNQEFSEAAYAKQVADRFQTDHTEILLSPRELIDNLPDALKAMDHPSGDGINSYVVSKAARNAGITVALSGLGGDELFAGYPIFKQFTSLSDKYWLMTFPKFLRRAAGSFLKTAKPGVSSEKISQVMVQDYLDLEYVYQFSREMAPVEEISKLSKYGMNGVNSVFNLVRDGVGFGKPGYDLPKLSKVSYAELYTYLEAVLLRDSDQMSMAHALELRVPFLDHELVQTVMSIPDKHKYPHTQKKLFVDAMSDYLIPEVVNRPKMGFTFPWKEWMKTDLKDFCHSQIQDLGKHDAFDAKMLDKRWDQFIAEKANVTWSRIWYLCVLQSWISNNDIKA